MWERLEDLDGVKEDEPAGWEREKRQEQRGGDFDKFQRASGATATPVEESESCRGGEQVFKQLLPHCLTSLITRVKEYMPELHFIFVSGKVQSGKQTTTF